MGDPLGGVQPEQEGAQDVAVAVPDKVPSVQVRVWVEHEAKHPTVEEVKKV